jgi:hypothetical protein
MVLKLAIVVAIGTLAYVIANLEIEERLSGLYFPAIWE